MSDNNLVDIFSDDNDYNVEPKKSFNLKGRIILIVVCVVLTLSIIAGAFAGGVYYGRKNSVVGDMPLLEEAYELLRDYYYEDISFEEFQVLATKGVMNSVDKFTWLEEIDNSTGSMAFGFSIYSDAYNVHTISNIVPESPIDSVIATKKFNINDLSSDGVDVSSLKIHVEIGDELYAISVMNLTPIVVEHYVSSSVNATLSSLDSIKLFIRKNGTDDVYLYNVEKAFIAKTKAFYYSSEDIADIENDTAMIKFSAFQDTAVADFSYCIDRFIEDGKKNLILDLRNNGGGNSEILGFIGGCLIKGADKEEKNIAFYKYNSGKGKYKEAFFKTNMGMNCETIDGENSYYPIKNLPSLVEGFKLTVLVNGGSASCSEALLGALIFYNDVEFVGTKTYGKGVGQTVRPLSDGKHYVYITNGKYFIPTMGDNNKVQWNVSIHGVGFTPDDENLIENSYAPYKDDECIKRALQILHN